MSVSNVMKTENDYSIYPGVIRWIILVAVMLGTIMQVLDTSIVNVAIPYMMGNLGATIDEINWVSTAYMISNVILLPLTGWLSMRFGRRRYLAYSIILFTTASFCCGMSTSLNQLILFRIIQGAGGAALISTAQATLIEIFPPQQLGMVQGVYAIGVITAPTIGPTLGGWITDNYSWPWIFFVNIPIGIIAATLTLIFLKDSIYQTNRRGKVDFLGIVFLAIGLSCMQVVLEKGERDDWFQSNFIVTLTVISVVALVTFIYWELHIKDPAVNLRILKNRNFSAGVTFAVIYGFALYGGIFVLPIFLQNIRQYTAEQTGLIFLPGGLASMFVQPIAARLVSRVSTRRLVAIGVGAFAGSMYLMHFLTNLTGPENFYWPLVLRGVATGFMFIPLTLATLTGLKGKDLSYGTGLYNLMRYVGGSIGIAWLSTMVDNRISYHRSHLVNYANYFNPAFQHRMSILTHIFITKGAALNVARMQALGMIDGTIQTQASVLAFGDTLLFIARILLFSLPLLLIFQHGVPKEMSDAVMSE